MPNPLAAIEIQRRDVWWAVTSFCVVGAVLFYLLASSSVGRSWPSGTHTSTSVAEGARAVVPGQLSAEPMRLERTTKIAEIGSALVPQGVTAYEVAVDVCGRDDATISRERRVVNQITLDGVAARSTQSSAEVTEFNASGDSVQKTEQIDIEGQVLRFPADTKAVEHALWDPYTGRAWPAQYGGTTKLRGHEVLKFRQTVPATRTSRADDGSEVVVALDRTVWVRAEIGAVVDEKLDLSIALRRGSTASVLMDAEFRDTEASVAAASKAVEDVLRQRRWFQFNIPGVFLVVGMLAAAAAFINVRRESKKEKL